MRLALRKDGEKVLVHPIQLVVQDERGVWREQSEALIDGLGDLRGLNVASLYKVGSKEEEIRKRRTTNVFDRRVPDLNTVWVQKSQYTGEDRLFRADHYPLFDSKSTVVGLLSTSRDLFDQVLLHDASESIRSQYTAMSLMLESLGECSPALKRQNGGKSYTEDLLHAAKSVIHQLDALAIKHSGKKLASELWIRDCYIGTTILDATNSYDGLLFEDGLSGSLKKGSFLYPSVSLQIDTRLALLGHCDLAHFDIALRHCFEAAIFSQCLTLDVTVTESDDKKSTQVSLSWASSQALPAESQLHIKAALQTAQRGGIDCSWSKAPRSTVSLFVPFNVLPVEKVPATYKKISTSPSPSSSNSTPLTSATPSERESSATQRPLSSTKRKRDDTGSTSLLDGFNEFLKSQSKH